MSSACVLSSGTALVHVCRQGAKRKLRVPVAHVGDGGGERRIAPAQHLVHHRGRHPRPLEYAEGLVRIDHAELARVIGGGRSPLAGPGWTPLKRTVRSVQVCR